ncbi:MAG: nucleotidyltransferase domain-containing protein [Spirochaetota bacterium]|nr:nucleotidyltransferase domain-containing protein [Spirochaetota bacterium]
MTDRIVKELHPEKIILFGSYAWGEPDEDSDLDILVIVSQSNDNTIIRDAQAYGCLRGLSIPIDILVYTHEEVEKSKKVYVSLIAQIVDQGRFLYG